MAARDRKIAFITGAASGIGRATAELFAAQGWWIGAADRNAEGLEKLRDAIGKDRCRPWRLDVTDKAAYDAAVADLAEETGGRLDLLYNNAGIGAAGFFEEIPIEESLKIIDVNLVGVLNGIYAALPLLKATPNSLCFTTSSSSATYGAPSLAVYAATKFAVKGLTEALAVELSRCDVRVADVLPGLIDTAIFSDSPLYVNGRKQPTAGRTIADEAPAEGPFRLIPPSRVAEAVWRCYEGDARMHWYVPDEIEDIDKAKAASPEAMRDARIAGLKARAGALRDEPGEQAP
ncbi:MAG: SDR family oxidoreductase [Planctomycetota bacterium]|jgi:NAD(P)-dependent dehydrogenase (short-subunit alcohol dehydrogenase family)